MHQHEVDAWQLCVMGFACKQRFGELAGYWVRLRLLVGCRVARNLVASELQEPGRRRFRLDSPAGPHDSSHRL